MIRLLYIYFGKISLYISINLSNAIIHDFGVDYIGELQSGSEANTRPN